MIKVKGLVNDEVFDEIFQQVVDSRKDNLTCIIIGSLTGSSTCQLGQMLKRKGKKFTIFSIDDNNYSNVSVESYDWLGKLKGNFHSELVNNIEKCNLLYEVEVVVNDSIEESKNFKDKSIDFLFADGSHFLPYVTREILTWLPKMRENSIFSGHDFSSIASAVYEGFANTEYRIVPISDYSGYFVQLGKGL